MYKKGCSEGVVLCRPYLATLDDRYVSESGVDKGAMELNRLSDQELTRLMAKNMPERYGDVVGDVDMGQGVQLRPHARNKKQKLYDIPALSALPPGQRRAVEALIGSGTQART